MDKEQTAIDRLKMAALMSETYYDMPLIVTISGGKDSDICVELARRAGIAFEVQHNLTTADAPQTIYHVREQFRELELAGIKCTINKPTYKGKSVSMWTLIPQKLMPPTRLVRYCCDVLKEQGGRNRMITTGVRSAESAKRAARGAYETVHKDKTKKIVLMNDNDAERRLFENCRLKAKRICNPIIDWSDRDVWDFIRAEQLSINPLYEMGFSRVGCIGCPMAGDKRYFEFRMFPAYERMYRRAFDRLVDARKAAGKSMDGTWSTGEGVFRWWMEENPDQITFDDLQIDEEE